MHVYLGRSLKKERIEDLYLISETVSGQVKNFGDVDCLRVLEFKPASPLVPLALDSSTADPSKPVLLGLSSSSTLTP